jgi:probable F420-dependent oxidoreductase
VKLGLTIFPTADSMRPAALARAAEERGFDSLWLPEHSHFPVSPFTPGPDAEAGPGREYYELLDPFAALASAAEATRTLLLGTSICLVVQRDPIQLAKQVATLDVLSGGRFLFGVGAGWHPLEMGNHGTAFDTRVALMSERLEAMKTIWREEQAEYHGRFVDFAPLYQWPKPLRKPHPPIHVGANGAASLGRVVREGDAWLPVLMSPDDADKVLPLVPELRRRVEAAGRDPAAFEVSVYMCPAEEAMLERCAEAGVDRAIFLLPSRGPDAVLPLVDAWAGLQRRLGDAAG